MNIYLFKPITINIKSAKEFMLSNKLNHNIDNFNEIKNAEFHFIPADKPQRDIYFHTLNLLTSSNKNLCILSYSTVVFNTARVCVKENSNVSLYIYFLYKNYQYDMIKADKFGHLEKWPKEVEKNDYEYITLSDLI